MPLNVLEEVSSNETGTIGRYDDYMDFLSKNLADDEPQETPAPRVSPAPVLEPGAPSDLELMQGIQQADPEALSLPNLKSKSQLLQLTLLNLFGLTHQDARLELLDHPESIQA